MNKIKSDAFRCALGFFGSCIKMAGDGKMLIIC